MIGLAPKIHRSSNQCSNTLIRGYYPYAGGEKWNGSRISYGSPCSDTDIVGIAYDLDNGTIEFYKNGISMGVAFNDLKIFGNTLLYPTVIGSSTAKTQLKGLTNFGATPFVYPIPEGFKAYDSLPGPNAPSNLTGQLIR